MVSIVWNENGTCHAWTQVVRTNKFSVLVDKSSLVGWGEPNPRDAVRLSAWNNMGGYLDGLSSRTEQYEEPQQQPQQDKPYQTSNGYQDEQSQYAHSLSTSSTDNDSSGWSSVAWQQQYDALQRKNGNQGSLETEIEVDDAVVKDVIEKHSSYWFGKEEKTTQPEPKPLVDWSSRADEIARRIEMASQYSYGTSQQEQQQQQEPAKVNGVVDWSSTQGRASEIVTENMQVEQYFHRQHQANEQSHSSYNEQHQGSVAEEVAPDVERQLDDFEERALRIMSTEVGYKKLLGQNPYAWTDAPVGTLLSRGVDTIEDAVIHMRRLPYKLGLRDLPDESVDRPTVVVLGTGWGAHAFVKVACTFDLKVVVVSPVNHFVFTPMLASAAVGTVEYRSMTEAIRASNPTIDNYIEGKAIGVDPENKELTVELTTLRNRFSEDKEDAGPSIIKLNYDYLIAAVGTQVRSSIVPGAQKYCFNLKTTQDSKLLRTAIGEALEFASRPDVRGNDLASIAERRRRVRFVIIGGGPTGVELAGEINDFLKQICKPRKGAYGRLKDDVAVMLVHGGPELLPMFDEELRDEALAALTRAGIEVRLNTRLTEVGKKFIRLKEKGTDTVEETVPCGLSVWGAGNEPAPFVKELLSKLPEEAAGVGGRVKVDRWLRVPTHSRESSGSILVIGDAACMQTNPNDPGTAMPQTAQVAGQQGAFAARLLNRRYDLTQTPPRLAENFDGFSKLRIWLFVRGLDEAPEFTFLNLGILAYVGGGEALAQVQLGDVPIFNYAGNVAFALWRSVYLVKQVATRNRALVTFDWVKSELFGRDITRL